MLPSYDVDNRFLIFIRSSISNIEHIDTISKESLAEDSFA